MIYEFKHKKSGEIKEIDIPVNEYDDYIVVDSDGYAVLKSDIDFIKIVSDSAYLGEVMNLKKNNGGFKEVLEIIDSKTPGSTIKNNATLLQ